MKLKKGGMSKEPPKPRGDAGNGGGPVPSKRDTPSGNDIRVGNNTSGRVKHDERGNAIWEWAVSTGVFGLEASTSRLKKLENPSLSLAEDKPPKALSLVNPKGVAQGYSPYDSGVLPKSKSAAAPKKDLRRLSEWLKLRKQAGNNNQDED